MSPTDKEEQVPNEPESTSPAAADSSDDAASSSPEGVEAEPVSDPSLQTAMDDEDENDPSTLVDLPDFGEMTADAARSSIELLKDVELNVKIELGRAEMSVEEILKLHSGSVVELDKLAGDPVDVFVNEQLVARGEVLVLNDNFCVRINEIIPGLTERMAQT